MTETSRPAAAVVAAMVAFAANSLLCRLALREPASIDAASFTTVRLVSGALALALIVSLQQRSLAKPAGSWPSAAALFTYAIAFSVAYLGMTAGTGALILFASVQLTMFAAAVARGRRPKPLQWLGLALALGGLVVLTWQGVAAPEPLPAALMALAGCAWGVYSLRGAKSRRPLADTAGNFLRATPLALVASLLAMQTLHVTPRGLVLAAASGAIASGLGYTIWYTALPRITAASASIVQLSVPLLAAAGGVAFLGEHPSLRLAAAAALILGGIAMALLAQGRR